jgi:hypothetical protein
MQLVIKKTFQAGRLTFKPGKYQIGADISATLAKCAVSDGYGEIKGGKSPAGSLETK